MENSASGAAQYNILPRDAGYTEFIATLDKQFANLSHMLAGEIPEFTYNSDGTQADIRYINKFPRIMNNGGINQTIAFVENAVATKNTFFSFLTAQQAEREIYSAVSNVRDFLFLNRKDFDLSRKKYNAVCTAIGQIIAASYRRSINAKTLDTTSGTVHQNYTRQDFNDKNSHDGLKALWPFK